MRGRRLDVLLMVLAAALLSQAAPAQTPGKITQVRVYQGQALVTRQIDFEATKGPQDVTVTELPDQIIPQSLYATGSAQLSIRAVRFRATATETEPRPEVQALDDQMKAKQKDIRRIESELSVLEARGAFLDKLGQFAATKVDEEMQKGTLNPGALQETATFVFEQREEIAQKTLALEGEKEAIEASLSTLERKRRELTHGSNKVMRDAAVSLDAAKAGPAKVDLSYLVSGVSWSPAYSVRLNDKHNRIRLEYHAALSQMSGEDWGDVELTLSTSHPKMMATAPLLTPLRISLIPKEQQEQRLADQGTYTEKRRELQQQIRGKKGGPAGPRGDRGPVGMGMGGAGMMGGGMMGPAPPAFQAPSEDDALNANVFAAQLQNIELTAPDEVVRMSRAMGATGAEGLAVDYPIPGLISIPSRRDQQMLSIAKLDLKATFNYVAVPLLTDYVYRTVECVNDSDYPLLAGPYNAYVEGAFAGRGMLPIVAHGQGLTLGFGSETQLRGSRELLEKTTTVRGGNQVVQYSYRLALRNYMDKPTKVRLWDRLPQTQDKQVTIQILEPSVALSTDAVYLAQHRARGLLRWDVEVPAKASGADAYQVKYQFQIEFDKNFDIGELPSSVAEVMRKDMDMLKAIQASPGALR